MTGGSRGGPHRALAPTGSQVYDVYVQPRRQLQQHANEECNADANCALKYVALPEAPEAPIASNFSIWGHWAHVENPLAVRAEIEAFVG